MRRFRAQSVLLLSILLFSATPIPAVAVDELPAAGFSSADVDRAIVFRSASGFRDDRPFVSNSFADAATFSNRDYGLPLTAAEAAEVDRRISVQRKADEVVESVAGRPDYGGLYTDLLAGGVPVFLVTAADSPIGATARNVLAGVATPRIEVVRYSRHDLEEAQARIWADRSAWKAEGIVIQSTALDIVRNSVVVGVVDLTPDATTALKMRYPDIQVVDEALDTQLDACNSVSDCYPMKGGIKIVELNHSNSWCTAGFNVRLRNTSTFRVLTAGHCLGLAINGPTGAWTHGGTQFGTGKVNTWTTGSDADAGLISVANPSPDNKLFGISTADIRTVGGYRLTTAQNAGDYLCRQGATSGFWCGNITLESKSKLVDGRTIDKQWVVNFDAMPGDSGGPYFTTSSGVTTAWGIHSDSPDTNPPGGSAWYSPMQQVFSVLLAKGHDIVLCTDQYCGL